MARKKAERKPAKKSDAALKEARRKLLDVLRKKAIKEVLAKKRISFDERGWHKEHVWTYGDNAEAGFFIDGNMLRIVHLEVKGDVIRRVGIGKAIIEEIENFVEEENKRRRKRKKEEIKVIDVFAGLIDKASHPYHFYRKLGFELSPTENPEKIKKKIGRLEGIRMVKHLKKKS